MAGGAGFNPQGAAVNDRIHTLYVGNNALGDLPGTVSVLNMATCNGSNTSGCARHHPAVLVGKSPISVAVEARTDTAFAADFASAAVSVINTAASNATSASGCRIRARLVGSEPLGVSVNQRTGTVYATQLVQSGSMSILPHHLRTTTARPSAW